MKETQKFTERIELRLAAVIAAGLAIAVLANKPIATSQSNEQEEANGSIYHNPEQPPEPDISRDVLVVPAPRFQLPRV